MKKLYQLAIMAMLAIAMTACSSEPKEKDGTNPTGAAVDPATRQDGLWEADQESLLEIDPADIPQGDPIVGIVAKYENGILVIKDGSDEDLIYYFSTQNAEIIEGEPPIAVGELVEITYQGVMGDEEQPGMAVKVVAESMMYRTERDDT